LLWGTEFTVPRAGEIKQVAFGEDMRKWPIWLDESLNVLRATRYLVFDRLGRAKPTDKAIQELSTYGYIVDNNSKGE